MVSAMAGMRKLLCVGTCVVVASVLCDGVSPAIDLADNPVTTLKPGELAGGDDWLLHQPPRRETAASLPAAASAPQASSPSAQPASYDELQKKSLSELRDYARGYLKEMCDWIVRNDVSKFNRIYPQGNYVKTVLCGYRVHGDQRYLDYAVSWADGFVKKQKAVTTDKGNPGGSWHRFLADTGTAASPVIMLSQYVDDQRRREYLAAVGRYARYVIEGPKGGPAWVVAEGENVGALTQGGGEPYSCATATSGCLMFGQLCKVTGEEPHRRVFTNAVAWLVKTVRDDGRYDAHRGGQVGPNVDHHTISYYSEGLMAAHRHLDDAALRARIGERLGKVAAFVAQTSEKQPRAGSFNRGPLQLRPQILLWHYHQSGCPKEQEDLLRKIYAGILSRPVPMEKWYTDEDSLRSIGFLGLVVADFVEPGITFRLKEKEAPGE